MFAKLQDPVRLEAQPQPVLLTFLLQIDRALHKVHGGIERTDIDKVVLTMNFLG